MEHQIILYMDGYVRKRQEKKKKGNTDHKKSWLHNSKGRWWYAQRMQRAKKRKKKKKNRRLICHSRWAVSRLSLVLGDPERFEQDWDIFDDIGYFRWLWKWDITRKMRVDKWPLHYRGNGLLGQWGQTLTTRHIVRRNIYSKSPLQIRKSEHWPAV